MTHTQRRDPWSCGIVWGLTACLIASVVPVWTYRPSGFCGTGCQTTFWGMMEIAAAQVGDPPAWSSWLRFYLPHLVTMLSVFVVATSLGWCVERWRQLRGSESD